MKDYPDVLDKLTLQRGAVGFIADRIGDSQASAALHLIELSMEEIEVAMGLLIQKGIDGEVAGGQENG